MKQLRTRILLVAIATFISLQAEAANNGVYYQIPTTEYNALVDLYNQADGSGWANNSGWLNPNATNWFGVYIAGVQYDSSGNVAVQGHVTQIICNNNQLSGSIPTSLGNLSQLQYLIISYNQLSGSIPTNLCNLLQIQSLDLSDNDLSGSIPTNLGNLSLLQELWFGENQLSGSIPTSLCNLLQLQYLDLSDNDLSGSIPTNLGNLSQLIELWFGNNKLSGSIPISLGNLSQLQVLALDGGNQLSGNIPSSLGNLSQLQDLWLDGNQLTGSIPTSLGNLTQVQKLILNNNQLSGNVPPSFGNLTQLQKLGLANNQLTGAVPYFNGPLNSGAYLSGNWLQITPGTQSRLNIDLMVAAGKNIVYLPQYGDNIAGHIYCSCDSNVIAGATVLIGNYYSATSAIDGSYSISGVPPDTYTATVTANNYAPFTNMVTFPATNQVVTNDFYLTNLTLVINPLFDSTITGNANAPTITNSIKAAIQVYKQTIANPICVRIRFSTTTDPAVLGENNAARANIAYSQYLADLQANPNKSVNDNSALASLPAGPGTGINGNTQITLTSANLEAIGETGLAAAAVASGLGGGYDGEILLNVTSLNGLQATIAHEIDETLGTGGWGSSLYLKNAYTGQASPTTGVGSLDLFRYSTYGVRSFTLNSNAISYFSIDGGRTRLVYFNQFGFGSDFGDWGDGVGPADGLGNNPPQVQDAFGSGNPEHGGKRIYCA